MEVVNTIGRRKAAIARVYTKVGKGEIKVNSRDFKEYFPLETLQYIVSQPLQLTNSEGKYDINVNIAGGGTKGQAEAIRLGISRALVQIDAESNKEVLKANKMLTRDPRQVERKKPGQPKARKRFQFSKR
ncbi:MAG: 30S ribosomal protein S9 [Bacteroidales bacterium]|nr:30S ribosomal protein S9 [Bacteroidales bacterium]MBN2817818.1 30S ribosomal protein S9 [Bacteroidales bacterium]